MTKRGDDRRRFGVTARGRVVRSSLGLAAAALLLIGTVVGDDDNFPFGPFRMYSTKQKLHGEVRATEIHGLTASGRWTKLAFEDFGLRRADIEGQLGKLAESPTTVLRAMYTAYDRLHAGPPPFLALGLFERTYDLEKGRSVAETVETIGTWRP